MMIRLVLFIFIALFTACSSGRSEIAVRYDLCFREDYPGATDRYVEYIPVRCSDPSVVVADRIGGERASLEVLEGEDGLQVVVSSEFWCRWGFEPCLYPTRTTFKITGSREQPVLELVREERLQPAKEFQ